MSTFTTSLHLELVNFNISTWHDQVNGNFTILDAAFRALTGLVTQGAWTNNTAYTVGQRVVDTVGGNVWTVAVNHTSIVAPSTFAQDRVAHPTFWVLFTQAVNNRGTWTTATVYNVNDFVVDNNRFGVAKTLFTSSASYNQDVLNGNIVTLIDMTPYVTLGVGQTIASAPAKVTPVAADKFGYSDSGAAGNLVSLTYTQLRAALFDSPTFTNNPDAPTPLIDSNDTSVPTTEFVVNRSNVSVRRNIIVNPSMIISQENISVAGSTNLYYPVDQFQLQFVTSAGTTSIQRVASVTPNGSSFRIRLSITVADAALAAGEVLFIRHPVEGYRCIPGQWGTASAKTLLIRFGFKGPAGTYAVAIRNSAANRSYVREFTITAPQANTDTVQTVSIPGDTSGTWLFTNGIGLTLNVVVAAGSTFQTTANAWQAGNFVGTSSTSNGWGLNTNVFELFDVESYWDTQGTGGYPAWTQPRFEEDLAACQRYYAHCYANFAGNVTSASGYATTAYYVQTMRDVPTFTGTNGGNVNFAVGVGTFTNVAVNGQPAFAVVNQRSANGTGPGAFSTFIECDARL